MFNSTCPIRQLGAWERGYRRRNVLLPKGAFLVLRKICAALSSELDGALPGTEKYLCPVRLRTGIFCLGEA